MSQTIQPPEKMPRQGFTFVADQNEIQVTWVHRNAGRHRSTTMPSGYVSSPFVLKEHRKDKKRRTVRSSAVYHREKGHSVSDAPHAFSRRLEFCTEPGWLDGQDRRR
jgi:hypothetical protein